MKINYSYKNLSRALRHTTIEPVFRDRETITEVPYKDNISFPLMDYYDIVRYLSTLCYVRVFRKMDMTGEKYTPVFYIIGKHSCIFYFEQWLERIIHTIEKDVCYNRSIHIQKRFVRINLRSHSSNFRRKVISKIVKDLKKQLDNPKINIDEDHNRILQEYCNYVKSPTRRLLRPRFK